MGVTEQNLQWTEKGDLEKQLAHIDALAAAGARWVRLTLRPPFTPYLLAHIKRANQRGVKVLVHLESGVAQLYPPGTLARPGNYQRGGVAWDAYPLSALDLARPTVKPICGISIRRCRPRALRGLPPSGGAPHASGAG
jgi:hypothetical protein